MGMSVSAGVAQNSFLTKVVGGEHKVGSFLVLQTQRRHVSLDFPP
jgi:hypothetical protein